MSYQNSSLREKIITLPSKVSLGDLSKVSILLGEVEDLFQKISILLRGEFSLRFPEFNSYILDNFLYVKLVEAFIPFIPLPSNEECSKFPFNTIFDSSFSLILPTILLENIPFTSSKCSPERCKEYCQDIFTLMEDKNVLFSLIKGLMNEIAPNLSALVGVDIGARLIGCCDNSIKKFSFITGNGVIALNKNGSNIITNSDIVLNTPEQWKKQAIRLMSCKSVLAARMDIQSKRGDSSYGIMLRDDVIRKLEKMQEPAKLNLEKPIPPPQLTSSKKRGGRRQRKLKELYGGSSIARRKDNRMDFNSPVDDL